jgi:hypothetical protein
VEIVDRANRFLSQKTPAGSAANVTLTLGTSKSTPVALIRDDEFSDRYFLAVETKSGPVVRLTVAGDDLTHLLDALRQVAEDLGDDQ